MKCDATVLQQLQQSTLGAVLDDRHLESIATIATSVRRSPGEAVFDEGAEATALWVVVSGEVRLDMHVAGHGQVQVLTLGPRDLLGWSALVGDGRMSATATVTEESELLKLPAGQLKDLCLTDHTLGFAIMGNVARALAIRLRETRLQLLDLDVENRSAAKSAAGEN